MIKFDMLDFATQSQNYQQNDFIGDFHTSNAIAMYGKDAVLKANEVEFKQLRDNAKISALALMYGGSANVIKADKNKQQSIKEYFFKNLKGLSKHLAFLHKHTKTKGYVCNLFGLKIFTKEGDKAKVLNYPIQSSGAFLNLNAITQILDFTYKTHTNNLSLDLIHKSYYNHIVSAHIDLKDNADFNKDIAQLPQGNTLIVLGKQNTIQYSYKEYKTLTKQFIQKWQLEILI